jgi:propanol-preferring alcohol dehydrogenase
VGIDQTLQLSTALPRPGGAVVVSGTGGGSVPFGYGHSRVRGVSWVVTDSATKGDLRDVLALAEAGRISMHVETFDFGLVDEIIAKLADKAITGRAVVCP